MKNSTGPHPEPLRSLTKSLTAILRYYFNFKQMAHQENPIARNILMLAVVLECLFKTCCSE